MNDTEGTEFASPPPAPPPPPTGGRGNPWENRATLGIGNALIETVKRFASEPTRAFAETREKGDYGSPLLFAILLGWIGIVIGQIWSMLFNASMFSMFPGEMREGLGMFATSSAAGLIFAVVLAPVFIVIGLFIWTAILHVCVMLVGGLGQSTSGFEGTFRVISYASVTQLANIVPVVGGMVGAIWGIVLTVIGLTTLHRTTQGKAIAAILIPVILCCVCVGAAMFVGMASLMGMLAGQGQ